MLDVTIILGFFSNGWMLLWGSAAIIPLIIHLLSRRYRVEVPWATTRFLILAQQKSSRRFRFWQWLLLLLRMLAIILFAIALAEPIFETAALSTPVSQKQLSIYVLDASMSMKTSKGNESRWERACNWIKQHHQATASGDGFLLLTIGTGVEELNERILYHSSDIAQLLSDREPRDVVANLSAAIQFVKAKLLQIDRSNSWKGDVSVYIVSDLQATSWSQVSDETMPMNSSVHVVDITTESQPSNLYVSDIQLKAYRDNVLVNCSITNSSSDPASGILVQLAVDQSVTESQRIDVSSRGMAKVKFTLNELKPGDHALSCRLEQDDLVEDDQRHVTLKVRSAAHVLIISQNEEQRRFLDAAYRSIDPLDVTSSRFDSIHNFQEYDLIVLVDPESLTSTFQKQCLRYVQQGGRLSLWLGQHHQAEQTAEFLTQLGFKRPLIHASPVEGEFYIDPLNYAHPIVELFEQSPQSGLVTSPIFRYWKLDCSEDDEVQTVVQVGDDPLILFRQSDNRGSITVAAIPPTIENTDPWNTLAVSTSFVPLLHQHLKYVCPTLATQSHATSQAIEFPVPQKFRDTGHFTLTDIKGNSISRILNLQNDSLVIPPTGRAGLLELTTADERHVGQLAVNPPAIESELEPWDRQQLPSGWKLIDSQSELSLPLRSATVAPPNHAFRFFLALAILCLFVELLLSRIVRMRFA